MGVDVLAYRKDLKKCSEIFKALGHPTRVCIVYKLISGPLNVTQMQECLDIAQSNISQHLTILKNRGIIEGNRKGSEVIYSLVDDYVREIVSTYFNK